MGDFFLESFLVLSRLLRPRTFCMRLIPAGIFVSAYLQLFGMLRVLQIILALAAIALRRAVLECVLSYGSFAGRVCQRVSLPHAPEASELPDR